MEKTNETLIWELAANLERKEIDASVVRKSVTLLCEEFSFDCGMVYEIDQTGNFSLIERSAAGEQTAHGLLLREQFDSSEIGKENHEILAGGTTSFIYRSEKNSAFEAELLDVFRGESLAVSSITDESNNVMGLVVFLNRTSKKPISDDDSKVLSLALSMLGRYVSVRMYQKKIVFVERSLKSILDHTGIDIYVKDFYNDDILYVNESMVAPYGDISAFLGHKCWEMLFPGQSGPCEFCPQDKLLDEEGKISGVHVWNYQRPFDGSWFRVFSTAFRWMDGRLAHLVSSADITENKRNEEIIQYMANYDDLTGLPNRRSLLAECTSRIDKATERENGYVMFFDIDGFKQINDNLGHDAGDEFLIILGKFFSEIPLLKDSIYRNGGDEFVAIVGGELITKLNIINLVSFIHERFKKPWVLSKDSVFSNVSVGVACYPEDGKTGEELLNKADQAMYQIKKAGGGGLCFGYQLK